MLTKVVLFLCLSCFGLSSSFKFPSSVPWKLQCRTEEDCYKPGKLCHVEPPTFLIEGCHCENNKCCGDIGDSTCGGTGPSTDTSGCMTTPSRPDKTGSPSKANTKCIFPFTHGGKTYYSCAPGTAASNLQDDCLWCSTKVDGNGDHVSGQGEWGYCDQACSESKQNGGICSSSGSSYLCSCSTGFEGEQCEFDINECQVGTPCMNDGTCVNSHGSFSCECTAGFSGSNCQDDMDECAPSNPCNNGQCINKPGSYDCICDDGWQGATCEENIDECLLSPCGNGGTCVDEIGKYTCECLDGWTGVNCTEDVNECEETENICNYGICVNKAGTFECYCLPGYSGQRCANDFNECISTPCQNNGTCHNEVNKYRCECTDGFNGTDCENNINECEGVPCKFGATCIDGIADYTCSCLAGYTGRNCSIFDLNS